MSLHQRVSAGRRPSVSHGSSRHGASSSAPLTHTTATAASDYEQRLLDSLNSAHTELNKTNSERDRYKNLFEQASKKLADANLANTDLKSQIQNHRDSSASLKEKLQHLKDENDRLDFENAAMGREYAELKAKYSALTLTHQYNVLNGASPTFAATGSLPERPKLSRSSSKKERKEDRDERSRNRDKEKEKDRGKEKEKEKEKGKDKEREKEKEKEKEKKENKAEKERLSRRFEERRAPPPSAPPTSNRRGSFIEGWGPGGRSSSSGSSNRSYTNVAPGHAQGPAVTTHKTAYSGVPRTPTNPMTPRTFNGSGATTVYDDDAGYEDGNYHAYPISR